jgi:hypothetical protein
MQTSRGKSCPAAMKAHDEMAELNPTLEMLTRN